MLQASFFHMCSPPPFRKRPTLAEVGLLLRCGRKGPLWAQKCNLDPPILLLHAQARHFRSYKKSLAGLIQHESEAISCTYCGAQTSFVEIGNERMEWTSRCWGSIGGQKLPKVPIKEGGLIQ